MTTNALCLPRALALLSVAFTGCQSAELDLTRIDEPVLLNDAPFVAPVPAAATGPVARYVGKVHESVHAGLDQGWSHTNDAEAVAFERIGATRSAIGDLSIEVSTSAWNFLFLILEARVDIEATGTVREVR